MWPFKKNQEKPERPAIEIGVGYRCLFQRRIPIPPQWFEDRHFPRFKIETVEGLVTEVSPSGEYIGIRVNGVIEWHHHDEHNFRLIEVLGTSS